MPSTNPALAPFLSLAEADWAAVDRKLNAQKNCPLYQQAQVDKLARRETQTRELLGENT